MTSMAHNCSFTVYLKEPVYVVFECYICKDVEMCYEDITIEDSETAYELFKSRHEH